MKKAKAEKTVEKPVPAVTEKPAEKSVEKAAQQPKPAPVTEAPAQGQMKVKRESFRPNRKPDFKGGEQQAKPEQKDDAQERSNEPFAQPETVGGNEIAFNKRKRRRRNKKGGNGQDERQQNNDGGSYRQLDVKKVCMRAWTIFLADVSEEGLALMDDQTSREAARRAFRCAEFFMMEEARRKQAQKAAMQAEKEAAEAAESDSASPDAEDDGEE